MSLKEAIEGGQLERPRKVFDPIEAFGGKGYNYEELVRREGEKILDESGVSRAMEELLAILLPEFPDVEIKTTKWADGSVSKDVSWNHQRVAGETYRYTYLNVGVNAYPLTKAIQVRNMHEYELLEEQDWCSDPRSLDDAIARAYRDPVTMSGPPLRM